MNIIKFIYNRYKQTDYKWFIIAFFVFGEMGEYIPLFAALTMGMQLYPNELPDLTKTFFDAQARVYDAYIEAFDTMMRVGYGWGESLFPFNYIVGRGLSELMVIVPALMIVYILLVWGCTLYYNIFEKTDINLRKGD